MRVGARQSRLRAHESTTPSRKVCRGTHDSPRMNPSWHRSRSPHVQQASANPPEMRDTRDTALWHKTTWKYINMKITLRHIETYRDRAMMSFFIYANLCPGTLIVGIAYQCNQQNRKGIERLSWILHGSYCVYFMAVLPMSFSSSSHRAANPPARLDHTLHLATKRRQTRSSRKEIESRCSPKFQLSPVR